MLEINVKKKKIKKKSFIQLQDPVENWPICDCLISFHSKGFPLEKAIQYAQLRKPYIINNLHMQYDIQVIIKSKRMKKMKKKIHCRHGHFKHEF